jgi:hypothetical protein
LRKTKSKQKSAWDSIWRKAIETQDSVNTSQS